MLSFCPFKNGDKLLNLLQQNDHAISIEGLQEALQLSRRSILYLIKKVNHALSEQGDPHHPEQEGAGVLFGRAGEARLAQL